MLQPNCLKQFKKMKHGSGYVLTILAGFTHGIFIVNYYSLMHMTIELSAVTLYMYKCFIQL